MQTVVAGVIAYLLLPSSILTAPYLTEEEKEFALRRLEGHADSESPERIK